VVLLRKSNPQSHNLQTAVVLGVSLAPFYAPSKLKKDKGMKIEPISVFAINATVVADVTPTGNPKYIIQLSYDAGTAIDRVQDCSDYRKSVEPSSFENDVFLSGSTYIAYSFNPLSNNAVYLLTCRCAHPDLTKEESFKQIERGMEKAFEKLNEQYKKQS
jgi:hypothetical protein